MSCIAARKVCTAIHGKQCTLGLLFLYRAMYFPCICTPITVSIGRNKNTHGARPRSELVSVPWGFLDETMLA